MRLSSASQLLSRSTLIPPAQPICCCVPSSPSSPRPSARVCRGAPTIRAGQQTDTSPFHVELGTPSKRAGWSWQLSPATHPPWKEAARQLLPKSEPTWHRPGETHFFWSLKQENHHKPEAESASHSASGFSAASACRSVLMPQSRLCQPGRGTGADGDICTTGPTWGGGWSWS